MTLTKQQLIKQLMDLGYTVKATYHSDGTFTEEVYVNLDVGQIVVSVEYLITMPDPIAELNRILHKAMGK